MKIIFFGTSNFAIPVLKALINNKMLPFLVITTPDKPVGRNQLLTPPPVKVFAEKHNIPVYQPERLKIENCPSVLSSGSRDSGSKDKLKIKDANLFIIASYGKIIPKDILDMPKFGTLNVHPSLLPKYRGPSPIHAAILNGDDETGVTIILTDEEVDHGPILAIYNLQFPISKLTYKDLEQKLAELGAKLLVDAIPKWISGKIDLKEQKHEKASYTKKFVKKDGYIDWNIPAEIIERKIRALNPWPGTYTFWEKDNKKMRLLITKASIPGVNGQHQVLPGKAGTVIATEDGFGVLTAKRVLNIKTLKPEGKKEMPAPDFLRGHPDIIGEILS